MKKVLFLDLEETIIKEIDDPVVLWENVKNIKRLVKIENFSEIQTFSFSLHNEMDFLNWKSAQNKIENHLECSILTQTFSVDDLKMAFLKSIFGHAVKQDIWEFCALLTKSRLFKFFIEKFFEDAFKHTEVWLVDDMVSNEDCTLLDLDIIIHFRNVNTL